MGKIITKQEFLKELKKGLSSLSKQEIAEIVLDYEGHFSEGVKNGRNEAELCDSLGDPEQVAKQLIASSLVDKAEFDKSASNILRAILAAAGLGIFNVIFIVGPFFGLLGTLVGIFAASIGVFVAGVAGFFASLVALINPEIFTYFNISYGAWTSLFYCLGLAALGNLMLIASWYIAKGLYIVTIKYLKFNLKVIIGKK